MSRFGRVGCVASLLFAGSLAASCADNESMLYVQGVMFAEPGSCEFVADSSAKTLEWGTYDTGFNYGYVATLLVGNQLASRGQKSRSRTETSKILLEGAEVTLLRRDGSELAPTFTSPGAGVIQVGSGEDTGFGMIGVTLVPRLSDIQLKDSAVKNGYVVAEVRVFGHTLGGTAIESGLFRFTINFCYGCLVRFSDASFVQNACVPSEDATNTLPCSLGQDQVVDCGVCASDLKVCQTP